MIASLLFHLIHITALIAGFPEDVASTACDICPGHNTTNQPAQDPAGLIINLSACELKSLSCIKSLCKENIQVTSINISWNYIRDINLDGLDCFGQDLYVIDLSFNDVYILQKHAFSGGTSIKRLNLAENNIYQIQTGAFDYLSTLQELDLSGNHLPGVRERVFSSLSNLLSLNLAGNRLLYIDTGSFGGLGMLETLDMSDNLLENLDNEAFTGLEHLKKLYLKGNKLRGGSFDFLNVFKHVNFLDISRNHLSSLDQNAFYGHQVKNVNISANYELKYVLQSAFLDMPLLETVDFSGNPNLYFIHEQTFINVPNLTLVNFTDTKISYLPILGNSTLIDSTRTNLCGECYNESISNCTSDFLRTNCFQWPIMAQALEPKLCLPTIVSDIALEISVELGQTLSLDCLAVGNPWPRIRWEREVLSTGQSVFETTKTDYFLKLHIGSLNDEGNYRCVAESNNGNDIKNVYIKISRIGIGIRVLTADATSIVVTWNRTHHATRHVILYRAIEETTGYTIKQLNDYWKLFRVDSLKPSTQYEICIASTVDINDKNCARTSTTREAARLPGIHHDTGVIAVFTISGFVFGLTLLAALYKCVHKLRLITQHNVFIVNSESRETFGDVTEATFTYENHYSDFLLDNEDKTEF